MENEIKTWLYDILQAIIEIEGFFEGKPKIFEEYIKDIKTKRAVERDIEIIAEAINRIKKEDKDFKIEDYQKIIGTRNIIAHVYHKISDEIIWGIVINHLPKLKEEVTIKLDDPQNQVSDISDKTNKKLKSGLSM